MAAFSSSFIPTPLAHADTLGEGHPKGALLLAPYKVSYLSAGKQLPSTNKLIPLTLFYNDSGIIHVGGRLKKSILLDSQKHPILLPKTDHAMNLIITDYHLKPLHAGPQLLQASLREKFWILSTRDAVRRVVKRCISCFRNRPRLAEQIMGDLPESRVCPSSVF
ncbi:integrase catalytic domain-containing protein [Trichonephila clavipes]|nr:integrase catalytic domain-containing protein [Trichonephila clavipes]